MSVDDMTAEDGDYIGHIETRVTIDWRALGEQFMHIRSDQQAEFLTGWDDGAYVLGYQREDFQYMHIAQDVRHKPDPQTMADRLRRLADFLEDE